MNTNESNLSKLSKLGLTDNQIEMVLSRIPKHSIDLFIDKWIREKKVDVSNLNQTNIPPPPPSVNQHENRFDIERGIYESRKGMSQFSPEFSRTNTNNLPQVPYVPRLIPNITDRISNEQMNQQYQEKTQSRSNPSANLDIMCRQLFGESPKTGYSRDFLDKKYRELAIQFHPDKGGDPNHFHMLVTCYKHLKGITMNTEFQRPTNSHNRGQMPKAVPPPDSLFDNKFDPNVFNSYYEKNSFQKTSGGHGDWLKKAENAKPPPRPSESNFNSAYESHKKTIANSVDNSRFQIMKHPGVPEELSPITNSEILGQVDDEKTDYTGQTTQGTQYTDIRRALETPHLLYEENNYVDTDISKNFAAAKGARGTQPEKMTPMQYEQYENMRQKRIDAEENRRYNLNQYDEDISQHFQQTHHNRLTMS